MVMCCWSTYAEEAARDCPFHVTTSLMAKFDPVIVICGGVELAFELAGALEGDSDEIERPLPGAGST